MAKDLFLVCNQADKTIQVRRYLKEAQNLRREIGSTATIEKGKRLRQYLEKGFIVAASPESKLVKELREKYGDSPKFFVENPRTATVVPPERIEEMRVFAETLNTLNKALGVLKAGGDKRGEDLWQAVKPEMGYGGFSQSIMRPLKEWGLITAYKGGNRQVYYGLTAVGKDTILSKNLVKELDERLQRGVTPVPPAPVPPAGPGPKPEPAAAAPGVDLVMLRVKLRAAAALMEEAAKYFREIEGVLDGKGGK